MKFVKVKSIDSSKKLKTDSSKDTIKKVLKKSLISGISFRETQAVLAGTTTNDLRESDYFDDDYDEDED